MAQTLAFGMSFLTLAHFTIATWAISPFFEDVLRLPIAAWYPPPFNTNNSSIFAIIYFYQIFGISMSACFNVATDTFASGMIAQANGQVRRLGIIISQVGHEVRKIPKELMAPADLKDDQIIEIEKEIEKIKKLKGEHYGEIIRCVIFHDIILKWGKFKKEIIIHCYSKLIPFILRLGISKKLKFYSKDQFLLNWQHPA